MNKNTLLCCTLFLCTFFKLSAATTPLTDANIKAAIELWISDESQAIATYGHISTWNVGQVTNMKNLFKDKNNFNADISNWDVSNVTDMGYMFSGATSFNADLSNWNVSKVTNMQQMFKNTRDFNSDISNWDVSNVTNMHTMFAETTFFNGDISKWTFRMSQVCMQCLYLVKHLILIWGSGMCRM